MSDLDFWRARRAALWSLLIEAVNEGVPHDRLWDRWNALMGVSGLVDRLQREGVR